MKTGIKIEEIKNGALLVEKINISQACGALQDWTTGDTAMRGLRLRESLHDEEQ